MPLKKHETAYMTLYRMLRRQIESGIRPYGSRLPSRRAAAAEFGVSGTTVAHTYEILCDEGYLEMRERSGCYVSYRDTGIQPAASLPERDEPPARETADVQENIPPAALAKTMRRTLSRCQDRLAERSPNYGCMALREAISGYLAVSRGMEVPASRIVIGSGAEYLYGLIVQWLGRERVFALEDPSYDMIRRVYEAFGVRCDMLQMGAEGIRNRELLRTQASVLHVTPFHSWPSGVTASASKRRAYVAWAHERHAYIVEDDFDSEFSTSAKPEDTLFSLDPYDSVIYINTFTKTVAPSIRTGYMLLPEHAAAGFREKVGFYSCTVPVLEQLTLAELIRSGEFTRHINRIRRRRRSGM